MVLRPGYLNAAAPASDEVAGAMPLTSAASSVDQFTPEPATLGTVKTSDPDCAPDGTFPIEAITPGIRIGRAGAPIEIARLQVPNESTYTDLAIQWWVDYPFLYDSGSILAEIRVGNAPPIAIPLPTYRPITIPKCIKPGQTIVLTVTVNAAIDISDGLFGNTIYVGGSLQAGYTHSQWFLRTADRARAENSVRSVDVVIAPGAPLANIVAVPTFIGSRVRVTWPALVGPAAIGRIGISTFSQTFGVQGVVAIDQSLGNAQLTNSIVIPMADLFELLVGSPGGFGLLAPATIVVEWDVWRIR